MTTAQRARELAGSMLRLKGVIAFAPEAAEALGRLAGMLEAALPEATEKIRKRVVGLDPNISPASDLLDMRALLDAYRVLAASKGIAESAHSLASGRAIALQKDADAARAEVERLNAEVVAFKNAAMLEVNGDPDGITPAMVEANMHRYDMEVSNLTERLRMANHGETEALKMYGAEKQRADRLAEGVRLTYPILASRAIGLTPDQPDVVALNTWMAEHGHLVKEREPIPAWYCEPCKLEVHLGETLGACPKCSKPMVDNQRVDAEFFPDSH